MPLSTEQINILRRLVLGELPFPRQDNRAELAQRPNWELIRIIERQERELARLRGRL